MKRVPIFILIVTILSLALVSASLTLTTCNKQTGEKCLQQSSSQTASTTPTTVKPSATGGNCQQPLTAESKCRFVEDNYGCEYVYSQGKDSAVCYEAPFSNQAYMTDYFNFKGLSLGPITEESTVHLNDIGTPQDPLTSFLASAKKAGSWTSTAISEGYGLAKEGVSWVGMKGWGVFSGGIKLVLKPVSWIFNIFSSKQA